jgi:hypothetical protein
MKKITVRPDGLAISVRGLFLFEPLHFSHEYARFHPGLCWSDKAFD